MISSDASIERHYLRAGTRTIYFHFQAEVMGGCLVLLYVNCGWSKRPWPEEQRALSWD